VTTTSLAKLNSKISQILGRDLRLSPLFKVVLRNSFSKVGFAHPRWRLWREGEQADGMSFNFMVNKYVN
jgi:hypothetical protein